jgi:glycine/D-amino acid oxidase-like deaminating enzyme/nitrite reductase/ring-hydroxylating ferredoxin subunit
MKRDGACNSLWQDTTDNYIAKDNLVNAEQKFDVIIAGAGITGITTGLLLQKAGKSVLIAEAQSLGFGTTGGTTAHLNSFFDTPYNTIQKKYGEKDAQLVAKAASQALQLIKRNVEEYNISCEYKELPGYLFSQDEKQTKELGDIFKASQECNVECSWAQDIPVPIPFEKALSFAGQATFHPTRYLTALAKAFEEAGGILLENCRITNVEEVEAGNIVTSGRGTFRAKHFIYATHIPPGVNLLHFRCAPYRSYAIAAKLEQKTNYPDALIYDMYDPYHYYRTQDIDGELYFIAGGEDHKTGHEENTEACFLKLEAHIKKYFPVKEIVNRWSSQYFEPTDGLPYIGHLPGHPGTMYVATGYGGNGMIYSAVAAIMLSEMISGGTSEYEELFDPNRIKMVAGFSNFVKEAADVVGHLIQKTILPSDKLEELAGIAPGEARVVKYEGQQLAIYKNEKGRVYALNSACTHIKCEVAWNSAEKTWDCPCHGSRFSYKGEMLTAPARKDLTTVEIRTEEKV